MESQERESDRTEKEPGLSRREFLASLGAAGTLFAAKSVLGQEGYRADGPGPDIGSLNENPAERMQRREKEEQDLRAACKPWNDYLAQAERMHVGDPQARKNAFDAMIENLQRLIGASNYPACQFAGSILRRKAATESDYLEAVRAYEFGFGGAMNGQERQDLRSQVRYTRMALVGVREEMRTGLATEVPLSVSETAPGTGGYSVVMKFADFLRQSAGDEAGFGGAIAQYRRAATLAKTAEEREAALEEVRVTARMSRGLKAMNEIAQHMLSDLPPEELKTLREKEQQELDEAMRDWVRFREYEKQGMTPTRDQAYEEHGKMLKKLLVLRGGKQHFLATVELGKQHVDIRRFDEALSFFREAENLAKSDAERSFLQRLILDASHRKAALLEKKKK